MDVSSNPEEVFEHVFSQDVYGTLQPNLPSIDISKGRPNTGCAARKSRIDNQEGHSTKFSDPVVDPYKSNRYQRLTTLVAYHFL